MLQIAAFTSDVPEFVTTGEMNETGYEVRVTPAAPHPFFSLAGVMKFIIHESESDAGFCSEDIWIIPVPDLSIIRTFTVQEQREGNLRLLVLSVHNEGDSFENPEIVIEIDRAQIHA